MRLSPSSDRGHAFERMVPRARQALAAGHSVAHVAQLIQSECGTTEQAHLVARAAQMANDYERRIGKVRWLGKKLMLG